MLNCALDALFAANHDRIYALCRRLTHDSERAADLTQEVFVTAYDRIDTYDGEGSFYAWLYGIARNLCIRSNARRHDVLFGEEGLFEPRDPARSVLARMRAEERRQLLVEACRAVLTPVEQEAVVMRYELNMPIEAINQALGLADASGARGLLQTCRRRLRRELARRLEELGHGTSLLFDSVVLE